MNNQKTYKVLFYLLFRKDAFGHVVGDGWYFYEHIQAEELEDALLEVLRRRNVYADFGSVNVLCIEEVA